MNAMRRQGMARLGIFILLTCFCLLLDGAVVKLKVAVDNARVKVKPDPTSENVARLPLGTVLTSDEKQGEWYKISSVVNGNKISGYIFEPYVEVIKEEEAAKEPVQPTTVERAQAELEADIKVGMEEAKNLIRQGKEIDKGINDLRALIGKVFRLSNNERQRELATEIFLWIGLAYAAKNDDYSALLEFKRMFEVDHAYSKDITRNVTDSKIMNLIREGENIFRGVMKEYSLDVVSDPSSATVKINGEEKGPSPLRYTIKSEVGPPRFVLEVEKKGYKPAREEIILMQPETTKNYILESLGRDMQVISAPQGARVYVDGQDTGKVTNCTLSKIPLGTHRVRVEKNNYRLWEENIDLADGREAFRIEIELSPKEYKSLSMYGSPDKNSLESPVGIALDRDNSIFVIDASKNSVKKLSPELRPQTSWGQTRDLKNVKDAAGVAVDSEGNFFITDAKNHNMIKFDKTGNLVAKWGKMGPGNDDFNTPLGIATDSSNNIFVADSRNNRIKKYSNTGTLIKVWGQRSDAQGDFFYPAAVAVNQKNEVYVVDRNRVQKFSAEGVFIAAWGKPGQGKGEFQSPSGITVDKESSVYVADSNNHRIQKFDENGNFILMWGTNGAGEGQLNFPAGVAVDGRGYVFVVEKYNQRIQVFGIVPD